MISSTLITDLQILGLTINEAKIIEAMVRIGKITDAPTISKISDVPRTKIYHALNDLEKKGLIAKDLVKGDSNKYQLIVSVQELIEILKKRVLEPITSSAERSLSNLQKIYKTYEKKIAKKQEIMMIKGRESINEISSNLIAKAKNTIFANFDYYSIKPLINDLCNANKSGINVILIMAFEEMKKLGKDNRELLKPIGIKEINFGEIYVNRLSGKSTEVSEAQTMMNLAFSSRPRSLIIDPETENQEMILIVKSPINQYKEAVAIQIANDSMIEFNYYMIKSFLNMAKLIDK